MSCLLHKYTNLNKDEHVNTQAVSLVSSLNKKWRVFFPLLQVFEREASGMMHFGADS